MARVNAEASRELSQRLDEFVSVASHDIRTPVAVIRGNIQQAQREFDLLLANEALVANEALDMAHDDVRAVRESLAEAGAGDQSGGTSHLICGLSVIGAANCGIAVDSLPAPARMATIHFRKFAFSAPTNAALPRILKNDVPSSDAIAPMILPSLLASPSSGFPLRSTTSTSPRGVESF